MLPLYPRIIESSPWKKLSLSWDMSQGCQGNKGVDKEEGRGHHYPQETVEFSYYYASKNFRHCVAERGGGHDGFTDEDE